MACLRLSNLTCRLYQTSKFYRYTASCSMQKGLHTSNKQHQENSEYYTVKSYEELFKKSVENPEEFWAEHSENISWMKKWDRVLDASNPIFPKWFPGGELNMCYNAVDRHVSNGLGNEVALIHDSPVTNSMKDITYKDMKDEISRLSGALVNCGVKYGDRVLIYMPMIPQAVMAMLACARIGAIHSLVFGGFAAKELSTRVKHAKPKVIISGNCGVEPSRYVDYKPMLDEAIELSGHQVKNVIIYNRPNFPEATMIKGRDLCYNDAISEAKPHDCVPVKSTDPLYLLYTSGTTGIPKAVVRPTGGHAVSLFWSMWNIYGLKPREVWWAASDLGWVVGHSYICYAPLLHANPSVIFEGKPVGTPDPGTYFRVIQDHKVSALFIAPTALRAIRREDPDSEYGQKYPLNKRFRYLFSAGEHLDHETNVWTKEIFRVPVLDNWWQTETGWAITASCIGLGNDLNPPIGASGMPVPGWNVEVVRKDLTKTQPGELGQIVVKLPLPPGALSSLWEDTARHETLYHSTYKGYYDTMDAGVVDEKGYISVLSRADDIINVAGHRLSTGSLEEAMLEHPDLAEAAAVGIPDEVKGMVPLGLCVFQHGLERPEEEVIKEIVQTVRKHIGPVASFKQAVFVKKLPKTRSGKIARNTIAAMAAGKPFKIPVTIEDASVYDNIKEVLLKAGFNASDPEGETHADDHHAPSTHFLAKQTPVS